MDVPALTREQSRAIDRWAIDTLGISGLVLMENAGRGCVDVLERLGIGGPVAVLCGKGNNAGDGFVIARHLEIRGYECRVLLLGRPEELRGDAAANFAILQKAGVPIADVAGLLTEPPQRLQVSKAVAGQESFGHDSAGSGDPRTTREFLDHHARDAAWVVDALLGTGARGEPRPPFDAAIDWMNSRRDEAKILAVDVPSGLDCDTGQPATHTVRADHTCTFVAMKIGYLQPVAQSFTGTVHICDIGVPRSLIANPGG